MLLSTYKTRLKKGYVNREFYIEDSTPTSPNYFDITEFPDYIGGGKSIIKLKGAGLGLRFGSDIDAEVLDAEGNVVYSEFPNFVDKLNNIYLSIYVYDNTVKGLGTISLVGEAEYDPDGDAIPEDALGSYNVRWTRDVFILPDFRNNSIIDFAKGPIISVAQTVTPVRVTTTYTSSLIQEVTSSLINYISTDPVGYDFDQSTVDDVLDNALNDILVNSNQVSRTANSVYTAPRIKDYDITNGYLLRENTRFNTYIYTSESFFKKDMTGGQFTFLSQPSASFPQLRSGSTLVDTLENQLSVYAGNIIKVTDERRALIDKPVIVSTTLPGTINNQTSSFKYTKLGNFTSSIAYKPTDLTYVTSTLSQSYVQFTLNDVDPIGGQIYRIKTFYKTSGQTGDYKLMNDQYIKNVEVLADPSRPNQVPYAKSEGDYYLIGHFTDVTKVTNDPLNLFNNVDWKSYYETPTTILNASCTTSSLYLSDAAVLTSSFTNQATFLFTTDAWQAYSINNTYTLTFNCSLEPGAELEVYANSTEIATETVDTSGFSRAFIRTENREKTRYSDNLCRFGKFIGSIKNNSSVIKNYGRIAFDFEGDSDGIGRPLFRLKYINNGNGTGSDTRGYISEVSIKPQQLQGFTPSIIQYAVPVDLDFAPVLSQSVDFKFEYYDYTGNQSEFVSYLKDIQINLTVELPTLGCQAEKYIHGFSGFYKKTNETAIDDVSMFGSSYNGGPIGGLTGSTGTAYYAGPTLFQIFGPSLIFSASDPTAIVATDNVLWNTKWYFKNQYTDAYTGPTSNFFGLNEYYTTSSWVIFDESIDTATNGLVSYTIDYPSLQDTSLIDDRYFPYGPSCCINKNYVNDNWGRFTGFNNSPSAIDTARLMNNRLFWPRYGIVTQSIAQRRYPGYFTQNGGVYQVNFKVKVYNTTSPYYYTPDSGSKLNVYMHNVYTTLYTQETNPYIGSDGNYPPLQNITTITFDSNTQWIDTLSGYKYAQFSTTLIQYGSFAQLVFEASGSNFNPLKSWNGSGWSGVQPSPVAFGGCIDDILVCKIGRTTDPYYIKPETGTGTVKPGNPGIGIRRG